MKKLLNYEGIHNEEFAPLMTKAEIELIEKVLKDNLSEIKVIVELGTYAGGTTIHMSKIVGDKAQIWTVDIFAINRSHIREETIENLKKYKNINLLEMTTQQAAYDFNLPVDFLFIDADHQDDSILKDCSSWLPKLRSGGIVVFDDYFNDDFPSVARRVEEQTKDWEIIGQVDTIMIKRKP